MDTIFHSTLVDDILDSTDSVAEARATLAQVERIFGEAGMEMAKFNSNHAMVLANVSADARAGAVVDVAAFREDKRAPELKTLGLCYELATDTFFFRQPENTVAKWTRRRVLKLFPRLYDPLGFLLPFSIRARIYFSSIASKSQAWDPPCPRPRNGRSGWSSSRSSP